MGASFRSLTPWLLGAAVLGALVWAVDLGTLERADFTFNNATEVKSLDPAVVTGQPENRMINALFEGLVRWDPETLEPIPGVAERWEISDDRLTYTFHIRDGARWSDGSAMTAEDFAYSMRRFLDPRTAAEYAYQAWYIKNARRYSGGGNAVKPGDAVEVELNLPPDAVNTRRGEVLRGELVRVENAEAGIDERVFVVALAGAQQKFRYADDDDAAASDPPDGARWCRQVLVDFRDVGVEVVDPRTIRFRLENPTPYFLTLLGFYPLFPVQQACVEKYGSPQWTYVDPPHIVCNGAFKPLFRRIRDRTRLVKNEHYWDAANVRLNTVDVLAVESINTALNLFLTDQVEWIYDMPSTALRQLLAERPPRDDLNPQALLTTYFYLLNTTKKPLDDVRVRRALSMALDRREITEQLLGAGERVALSLTPPGLPGYDPPQCAEENVAEARRLLAEAGFPGGRGFPTFSLLYNTHEQHQAIAELVRKQWQRNLGITVKGRNEEFATYLASQRLLRFDVSRRAWVGDYPDPNTFLGMYVQGGEQNCTGWGMPEYDALIRAAEREVDPRRRLEILADAERMLMDQLPILPVYFYVNKCMVKPYVRGFYNNLQDTHPLADVWIDREMTTPNPFLKGRATRSDEAKPSASAAPPQRAAAPLPAVAANLAEGAGR